MKRKKPYQKTKASSVKMTQDIADDIRQFNKDHPGTSFHKIAEHFGVNVARVSEVLNNERFVK